MQRGEKKLRAFLKANGGELERCQRYHRTGLHDWYS